MKNINANLIPTRLVTRMRRHKYERGGEEMFFPPELKALHEGSEVKTFGNPAVPAADNMAEQPGT
jgi:hypothetical protein